MLVKRKIQFISLDLSYSKDFNINEVISITFSSIAEFETNHQKAGKYHKRRKVITKKLISKIN